MIWSTPLALPTAPEQAEALGNSTVGAYAPQEIEYREPVEPVLDVPHRTVSSGQELARVPQTFDSPFQPVRRLYERITGGLRTTLLIPETQGDIDGAGKAQVMPVREMNRPYEISEPGPWYESFVRQL